MAGAGQDRRERRDRQRERQQQETHQRRWGAYPGALASGTEMRADMPLLVSVALQFVIVCLSLTYIFEIFDNEMFFEAWASPTEINSMFVMSFIFKCPTRELR